MKNQQNLISDSTNITGTKKRKLSSSIIDRGDDARLLRELKRKRTQLEEDINKSQKFINRACKGITEIGKNLKEGTIKPERLEFKKRVYNDFVTFLPQSMKILDESKLEFENCCSLILEIESSMEEEESRRRQVRVSDSDSDCISTGKLDAAVVDDSYSNNSTCVSAAAAVVNATD